MEFKELLNTVLVSVNLKEMITQIGEDEVKKILSTFECPQNMDVQNFIRDKAILFSQQGIARTHLIYWCNRDDPWGENKELVGYYTITSKSIVVYKNSVSKTVWKRIIKFGERDINSKKCVFSALLIGQLGKNYAGGNNCLISGNELLNLALDKIKFIQNEIGGKFTYLECQDNPKLIKFYEDNGFTRFGKRRLDRDETDIEGEYLIQLFKYL